MDKLCYEDHKIYAEKIFRYLVKNLRPIGYKEVTELVGYPIKHTTDKYFRDFLDTISETLNVLGNKMDQISIRINDDVPYIQSLVINLNKKSCGNGFYKFVGYPHPLLKEDPDKKKELTEHENKKCEVYLNWKLVERNY